MNLFSCSKSKYRISYLWKTVRLIMYRIIIEIIRAHWKKSSNLHSNLIIFVGKRVNVLLYHRPHPKFCKHFNHKGCSLFAMRSKLSLFLYCKVKQKYTNNCSVDCLFTKYSIILTIILFVFLDETHTCFWNQKSLRRWSAKP